jgi:hypothetical protein
MLLSRINRNGKQLIERQTELVAVMERNGHDGTRDRAVLDGLRQSQTLHEEYHQRIVISYQRSLAAASSMSKSAADSRVKACFERAAPCERRAVLAQEPMVREEFAHLAQQWRHMASDLEQIESERAKLEEVRGCKRNSDAGPQDL